LTHEQTVELANRLRDIYCPESLIVVFEGNMSGMRLKGFPIDEKTVTILIGTEDNAGDNSWVRYVSDFCDRCIFHESEFPPILYSIMHEIGHVKTLTREIEDMDSIPIEGNMYGDVNGEIHRRFPSEVAADNWMINEMNSNVSGLSYMVWEIENKELA